MHVPCLIGDYTDFYVGIHHATNVGRQFRPDNPLLPNYKYVPIGYHGRASSVRPSGEPVVRPSGQRKAPDADAPEYGASRRLDYELELGIWVGRGNELGQPIPIGEFLQRSKAAIKSDAELVWVAREFLAEHKVEPWSDMPVWIPPAGDTSSDVAPRSRHACACCTNASVSGPFRIVPLMARAPGAR